MIQQLFSEKLSLKNDKAKVGGFDTTNDGNTARRAFNAPEIFAEITGSMPQLNKKLKNHSYTFVVPIGHQRHQISKLLLCYGRKCNR